MGGHETTLSRPRKLASQILQLPKAKLCGNGNLLWQLLSTHKNGGKLWGIWQMLLGILERFPLCALFGLVIHHPCCPKAWSYKLQILLPRWSISIVGISINKRPRTPFPKTLWEELTKDLNKELVSIIRWPIVGSMRTGIFTCTITKLGVGLKHFLFTPLFGEDSHFDEHIFQMGWFNHQPDKQANVGVNIPDGMVSKSFSPPSRQLGQLLHRIVYQF